MGKRFAILICVAAAGVMALGAQTATSTTGRVDRTPPDLQLSGPKKQSPQNASPPPGCSPSTCRKLTIDSGCCDVEVRVGYSGEAFTVRAWGKLTNVKMDKLAPGDPIYVTPVPAGTGNNKPKIGPVLAKEAQRREVRKALDEGENVQAKVTLKATDAAGNVATAKRTITLVK
jgi:hypothetical protein